MEKFKEAREKEKQHLKMVKKVNKMAEKDEKSTPSKVKDRSTLDDLPTPIIPMVEIPSKRRRTYDETLDEVPSPLSPTPSSPLLSTNGSSATMTATFGMA